jgi:hypothetical protein
LGQSFLVVNCLFRRAMCSFEMLSGFRCQMSALCGETDGMPGLLDPFPLNT